MNDFIREIQEDMERQKWANLWQRYGRAFMAVIAAIVLGAAAWQVTHYVKRSENIKQTDSLLAAVKEATIQSLEKTESDTSGVHQSFAALIGAQLMENNDNSIGATEKLSKLASSSSDNMPSDLARALTGAGKSGNIFQFTALERAGWNALEKEDYSKAVRSFEAIVQSDKEVPASIYDRAKAGIAYANTKQNAPQKEK